jgi:ribosomal protein L11 methyltransferase
LLANQARWVLSAHRMQGLRLERMLPQGPWTTIVVRKEY